MRMYNHTLKSQATICLLENVEALMSKASEGEIKNDVIPLVFLALDANNLPSQVSTFKTIF